MSIKCQFYPLEQGLNGTILPDAEEVIVGRNEKYKIVNIFCSRQHLCLVADYKTETVTVKVVGSAPSCIDGKVVCKDQTIVAKDGSIIEVIKGALRYKITYSSTLKRNSKHLEDKEPKKIKEGMISWEKFTNNQVLIGTTSNYDEKRNKVASFDLDNTLIATKSGGVFPKGIDDWKIWHNTVKGALSTLDKDGWKIIVFTNQATLSTPKGKLRINDFKKKIENVIEALNVPVSVYISMAEGYYRKPAPGMWEMMLNRDALQAINTDISFYCGDAAGRPKNWKPGHKADFAMSDRLFALNIGIKFFTPEEFFLKEKPSPYKDITFDPRLFDDEHDALKFKYSVNQEVIVMVGSPASGKSHFVKTQLIPKGYECVSRDNLGSWQKCVVALKRFLSVGKNVVVDNTNPDIASRQRYIEVCKEENVSVRCVFIKTPLERCLHNNKFRLITDPKHEIVAPTLIASFHSNFQPPALEEGFSEIICISFKPSFSSRELEKLYFYYLLSK